jgi:hypothetical protein
MSTTNVWLPLTTLALGYAGSLFTESRRDRRLRIRETAQRDDERRAARDARRDEFQRETLLRVQEPLAKVARGAGFAHHRDVMAEREGYDWGTALVDDEFAENVRLAQVDLDALKVRLADDELREAIDLFKGAATRVMIARSRAASEQALHEMGDLYGATKERIGLLLRNLDS